MRRVIGRYTVKPGQETVNEKLVRAVYDELHQTQPTGLRYATFRLDDGTPGATVILPGVYLPGQDAIREAMAAHSPGR